jgi:hypothetical protein
MYGDLRDYECIFTALGTDGGLTFHHVGILTFNMMVPKVAKSLGPELRGYLKHFRCHCYLLGQVEFVVPDSYCQLEERLHKFGPHIHHLAFKVDNLDNFCRDLRVRDFELISQEGMPGIAGMTVNFIRPEMRGVLIEIVEVK